MLAHNVTQPHHVLTFLNIQQRTLMPTLPLFSVLSLRSSKLSFKENKAKDSVPKSKSLINTRCYGQLVKISERLDPEVASP